MKEQESSKGLVVFFIIVDEGVGSKILKKAKELGISGGTILLGKGTARNHFMQILGIDKIRKEIVLMICKGKFENRMHKVLTKRFHLDKPNHGIAFSIILSKILGSRSYANTIIEQPIGGESVMRHEVIFIIVDRGRAEEVVDAAVSAGAGGATIINARGTGIHEESTFFSIPIEPEKEIVMILSDKSKIDNIADAINKAIQISEPGNGMLFSVDVNKMSGMSN